LCDLPALPRDYEPWSFDCDMKYRTMSSTQFTNRSMTTSRESGSPDSREAFFPRKPLILVVDDHDAARLAAAALLSREATTSSRRRTDAMRWRCSPKALVPT
jgi:PleD family two-component response regulator